MSHDSIFACMPPRSLRRRHAAGFTENRGGAALLGTTDGMMFRGSWQVGEAQLERERLDPTDEQPALAWPRERADRVVIGLYEFMPYSAGALNPWGAPEWPGLQRARANRRIRSRRTIELAVSQWLDLR
jgi:hypothetical protein